MKYIIGNWKSNKTLAESQDWVKAFANIYQPVPDCQVVVAVPFPYLVSISAELTKLPQVAVASQDISPFPFGAYTGAVTVNMISELISFAIVGHSERRNYFHETHQEIANKVNLLLEAKITPIVCIDKDYAQTQFAAIPEEQQKQIIVAYEPLEAIGSGHPQDPEEVKNVSKSLVGQVPEGVPIIYGGSVNDQNAPEYLSIETVSGSLVGGASLDPEKFNRIIQLTQTPA